MDNPHCIKVYIPNVLIILVKSFRELKLNFNNAIFFQQSKNFFRIKKFFKGLA